MIKMKPYVKRYDEKGLLLNPLPYYHPSKPELDASGQATGRLLHLPNRAQRRAAASNRVSRNRVGVNVNQRGRKSI